MDPNEIIDGEDHNSDAKVAKKFSKILQLNHQEVKITPDIIDESWNDAVKFIEEPDTIEFTMYYYTNKFLSQNNIVIMSGDMGDELWWIC